MIAEPWQKYEVPGPVKALVITTPKVVSSMIKRARNPIFVVGHEAANIEFDGKSPIDFVIRIAKAANIPVVATANTVSKFLEKGFKSVIAMSSMDIGNRLTDSEWSVSDKKPPHDLALILGIPYYMGWVITSGLKSFAYRHLKTICIDRYYQPHCSWSFPNLSLKDWFNNLNMIVEEVEKYEQI
jgi:CO dehydrogenase/acetyl-CoA synthase complex epsilon subunit